MTNIDRDTAVKVAKITALAKHRGVDIYSRNAVYEHVYSIYKEMSNDGYTIKNVNFLVEAILAAGQTALKTGIDPIEILDDEDRSNDIVISDDDAQTILHHVWKTCGHPSNKQNIETYVKHHMADAYPEFQVEVIETAYDYYLRHKSDQDAYYKKLDMFNKIIT